MKQGLIEKDHSVVVFAQDLCKTYSREPVLNACNLQVNSREFVVVTGKSGCGKSTLLGILGLLDRPCSGQLRVCGKDVLGLKEARRARVRLEHIGFVFQSYNLVDELTVEENVELPLVYQGKRKRGRRRDVKAVLSELNLKGFEDRFPRQLSGGQQQRVAIARAVVGNPRVIFADEPTGNLDEEHGRDVLEILASFCKRGAAVVMATHSPEALQVAHRELHLHQGHLSESHS